VPAQSQPEYLTVGEVGAILRLSPDSVARRFSGRDGVIDLGESERMHKRRYRLLRISRTALNEFIQEMSVQ
jgi:hypothetical protein